VIENVMSIVIEHSQVVFLLQVAQDQIVVNPILFSNYFLGQLKRDEFSYAFSVEFVHQTGIGQRIIGGKNQERTRAREKDASFHGPPSFLAAKFLDSTKNHLRVEAL
jgi:hypothetical protein